MAASVVTKILRGFLKNLPKGEAKKLAREHGFLETRPVKTVTESKHPIAQKYITEHEQHEYLVKEPKRVSAQSQRDLFSRGKPEQEVVEEIDFKAWEKAGYPGLREYATLRLGTSKQKRLPIVDEDFVGPASPVDEVLHRLSGIRRQEQTGISDFVGPPSPVDEVLREASISQLASISPAQRQLLNFGRKLSTREIIESAIREGVYNPVAWNKAGLPPWPRELQSPRAMARVALDIPPARAFTKENQEAIAKKAREIIPLAIEQAGESGASLAKRANLPALREVRRSQVGSPSGRGVRAVNVEDYGTKIYERGDRPLSALTDEDIVSEGYRDVTKGLPVETRDEFGRLLSEFKEWGPVHNQRKRLLRNEEQAAIREGKLAESLSEEEMDDLVRDLIDRDPLYGRPFGQRFRVVPPFKGGQQGRIEGGVQYIQSPQRGQMLRIPQDTPPTRQDIMRLSRGEETPSEIAEQKIYEYGDEEIARSLGKTVEEMPTFQDELVTQPIQELSLLNQERRLDKIFDQEISGVPQLDKPHQNTLARVLQDKRLQTEREQFSAARSAAIRGRVLGQGRRNEAFAYGVRGEPRIPRVEEQLELSMKIEPTPEIAADLRNRAAEIRRIGNTFRAEANEKIRGSQFQTLPALHREFSPVDTGIARQKLESANVMSDLPSAYRVPDVSPQERRAIWEEIRSRPEYQQYKQAQMELKREIGVKAPDLMEFETYTRPQRTIPNRPVQPLKDVPSLVEAKPPVFPPTALDKAFEAGEITLDNPELLARWEAYFPERQAKEKALHQFHQKVLKAQQTRDKTLSENRIIKVQNEFSEKMNAITAGFVKKDGTANVTAWKKAGSPKSLDWEDATTEKVVKPRTKLVDSFKKGSKIVTRKRGGLIKKPRGWGAARYKCN